VADGHVMEAESGLLRAQRRHRGCVRLEDPVGHHGARRVHRHARDGSHPACSTGRWETGRQAHGEPGCASRRVAGARTDPASDDRWAKRRDSSEPGMPKLLRSCTISSSHSRAIEYEHGRTRHRVPASCQPELRPVVRVRRAVGPPSSSIRGRLLRESRQLTLLPQRLDLDRARRGPRRAAISSMHGGRAGRRIVADQHVVVVSVVVVTAAITSSTSL